MRNPEKALPQLLKKLHLYLHAGITEYWIVNPLRQELYVYCFAEQDIKDYRVYKGTDIVESVTFEGLQIPLQELFS